jgi:23S rRNA (guanosine2251-2'-O)-methyltransferase
MSSRGGKARPVRPPAELGGEQVEGHHAVHELLRAGRRRAQRIWVADTPVPGDALGAIVSLARRQGVPLHFKQPEAVAEAARTGASQGVIAWADPVVALSLDQLLAEPPLSASPFVLLLDGVTDPGNFGAILRTAGCAGVGGVVIGRHRAAPLTPAAVKAAAGAVETVPIAQVAGIPTAIADLTRSGIWALGLDPGAKEDLWHSSLLDGPVALVLGSEGGGLSHLVRQRCDALVRVPQVGALASLNVAAAAAVACFEVARRRATNR